MTRRIGMALVAIAAVSLSLASVSDAQAFGRRNGCGSWGGGGSNGSHGSFGGLFSRFRNGSHGSYGSNGGRYNGCGSHGGSYQNGQATEEGTESAHRVDQQGEVRYYGGDVDTRDQVAPAPPMSDEQDRREINARANVQADSQNGVRADTPRGAGEQGSDQGNLDNNQSPPGSNREENQSSNQSNSSS